MGSLGPLSFVAPWVLAALLALPALWYLLRVTPPPARALRFPALRLLQRLPRREETPARTPWWLLLLRLVLAALVIVGLAQPLWRAQPPSGVTGPLTLVLDNGWASGRIWPTLRAAAEAELEAAQRQGRQVQLLTTAPAADGAEPAPIGPDAPSAIQASLAALAPLPWPTDRARAAAVLTAGAPAANAEIVWFTDGTASAGAATLTAALQRFAVARVVRPEPFALPLALDPPVPAARGLEATVRRPGADDPAHSGQDAERGFVLRAFAGDGRMLGRVSATFAPGATESKAQLDLPSAVAADIVRLDLEGEATAAAIALLDERWRRRAVGLVGAGPQRGAGGLPLLTDQFYLERALEPVADIRRGTLGELLQSGVSVVVLPDSGPLAPADRTALLAYVRGGGMVLRFAGPRLAEAAATLADTPAAPPADPLSDTTGADAGDDPLLPVRLRRGDRTLGGALTWSQPAKLAPFAAGSPFAGLAVPQDVTVTRQVLAEPGIDIGPRTWANLSDGTPLVTAATLERGRVVLVHTTATPSWSNLTLSGLFPQLLQRILALAGIPPEANAGSAAQQGPSLLAPVQTIDGEGRIGDPSPFARPIASDALGAWQPGPAHPPGVYGQDQGGGSSRVLNLGPALGALRTLPPLPADITETVLTASRALDLKPYLLTLAVLLFLIDTIATLLLRGLGPHLAGLAARHTDRRAPGAGGAGTMVTALLLATGLSLLAAPADAQRQPRPTQEGLERGWQLDRTDKRGPAEPAPPAATPTEARAFEATNGTLIGYIRTGDSALDRVTEQGLASLGRAINDRTSIPTVRAWGLDPASDELGLTPLIYWAIADTQAPLPAAAIQRLNQFLRSGGMLLIDTRDQGLGGGRRNLAELAPGLDVPPLAPLAADHVLTRTFYLLSNFPGRSAEGQLWGEPGEGTGGDGVSRVLVGGNDWAGAWAEDERGRPLLAPGQGGLRQHEMALRFGINLMLYALTGNYKTDQVHLPFILERLGQ